MIDWAMVNARLGVTGLEGTAGSATYAALMVRIAGTKSTMVQGLSLGLSANATAYGVDVSPQRLAGFLGQTCHESANFTRLKEIGGPAYFKAMYDIDGSRPDKARELGNLTPGDGALYCGRSPIMLTGRANYLACGRSIAIDLVGHPALAETPDVAVLVALWYWRKHTLNAFSDASDWPGLTKAISGSATQHYTERLLYTNRALEVLLP